MKLFGLLSVTNAIPTVIWHGMGDRGDSSGMRRIADMVRSTTGNYVTSLIIGANGNEDRRNGFLMPVFDQIEFVCDKIKNDPELKDGYHALGFSQGAQFFRGVKQRCPSPPMINFVSVHGQHHGVYGFPGCDVEGFLPEVCDTLRQLLDLAYVPEIQSKLVQAQYWHDPIHSDVHRRNSQYIGPINNEVREGVAINQEYKKNLQTLNKFVMVKGLKDTTVLPRDTSWFEFYADGDDRTVVPLRESRIYKEDLLGLRQMDEDGKLEFLTTPGNHMSFSDTWFKEEICKVYLQ